ncbi:hypothetical protein PAHAL_2G274300 [Panicum hallii]|uniref:F-box protein AT5G49610-like beta-propeller domain-containing protein n=1 Tax=Panicum hallii TaxID=206008 RepID=A0A2S3GZN1_9POAL|nr:uncharacterized protein LOC112881092 [Panicum hallii]PAN12366.2 hypothetical protein PAHAL_2G274300 [Panicum hallii]
MPSATSSIAFPRDEPACLFRVSLVCRTWHLLLSEPSFLRRYREHHRTSPVLGFLYNKRFVPTTAAEPPLPPPPVDHFSWVALDCRHGRVLLHTMNPTGLVIWDPITGDQLRVPEVPDEPFSHLTGAVLCAANGCDLTDCRRDLFFVVFGGTADEEVMEDASVTWVSVYSSETGIWSVPAWIHLGPISRSHDVMGPSLLIGNTLHFLLEDGRRILKYELGGHDLSVMNTPPLRVGNMALVMVEDGKLGVAGVEGYNIHLWSWRGAAEWVQGRAIELDMMLSMDIGDPSTKLLVVGFSEGANTIFISANAGIFAVELKSDRIRKISGSGDFDAIIPYASFYSPGTSIKLIYMFPQL